MNAKAQLESFIDRFTPEIATVTRKALAKMRKRLPGAVVLVYDNYNALAIGFCPNERPSDAIFSLAVPTLKTTDIHLGFLGRVSSLSPKRVLLPALI